ncbi:hypothetical protein, partial [Eubacterium aggregans]
INAVGFDADGQILIDFSNENVSDEAIIAAAKELGLNAESAEGNQTEKFKFGIPYGYWWIYKEI